MDILVHCKYLWYGNNSMHKCNCTLSNCNHINGCLDTTGIPNKFNISVHASKRIQKNKFDLQNEYIDFNRKRG